MKTKLVLIAVCALALVGCKGITKTFLGAEGGDGGVISVDSTSVYGKHQLRSMNPVPGYSVLLHVDGTMEMRWIGTNAPAPDFNALGSPATRALQGRRPAPSWSAPLIVDPLGIPIPTPNSAP